MGPLSLGVLQDGLFRAEITEDGNFFAFAGWGDKENKSPQILVFQADSVCMREGEGEEEAGRKERKGREA
jgi:hypothetical protein